MRQSTESNMREVVKIIMSIKDILLLVAICIMGICLIIAFAVAVVRFIRKKKNGESVTLDSVFWDVVEQGMALVGETETIYKALTGATGIKTGPLKLDSVLNKVRDLCAEKGIPFDKEKWTKFIEEAVKLLNNGREEQSEAKPEEAPADSATVS